MPKGDDGDVTPPRTKQGRPATDYVPPALPTTRVLHAAHVQHLYASGLSDATVTAADLYTVDTRDESAALLGRGYLLHRGSAIAFPLYWPGDVVPYAFRVRPDTPRIDKRRGGPVKYDQPIGIGVLVYYPPRTRASVDALQGECPLYLTEGEKKALVLDQLGYAVIGLTGVENWSAKERDAQGRRVLHERITKYARIAGRPIVIVFDQDSYTKREVMRAAHALAGALLRAGAASVVFVTPPELGTAKGIDDYFAAAGEAVTRELLDTAGVPISDADPTLATDTPVAGIDCLAGAPLPDGAQVPRGYQVHADGMVTCSAGERTVVVSPRPILIVARYADHGSGEQYADVVWRDGAGWQRMHVPRKSLIDTRGIVEAIGRYGAPVTSQSARQLAPWFLAWELANADVMPVARSVAHTGWVGRAGAADAAFITYAEAAGVMATGELAAVTAALRPRGDYAAHLDALRAAWRSGPVMRRVLCAALAAPLLAPLDQRGFALHLCGDSSRGKTTMLRIAASIFGDPDDPAWVATWNTTANAAESRAATLCDLPLFFDEIGASDPIAVQRLIYTLANGESRGRMSSNATVQRARHWRTVVMSSGEHPLAEGLATGAQARVMSLAVDGFGGLDGDGVAIDALRAACTENAGSFGQRWIAGWLEQGPADWTAIRTMRTAFRGKYLLGASKAAGVRSRMADYCSLLGVVEEILVTQYGFDSYLSAEGVPSMCNALDGVDVEHVQTAADAMADEVEAWIAQHPESFPVAVQVDHRGTLGKLQGVHREVLGVRVHNMDGVRVEVLINPRALRTLFDESHRSYSPVMREWERQKRIHTVTHGEQTRAGALRRVDGLGRSRWIVWIGDPA